MSWGTGNLGAGGIDLNFKVVGGMTPPTDPAENTIWVKTDQEITRWSFDSVAPAVPIEGEVHIITTTVSENSFNAIKDDNCIELYTNGVSQYLNSKWVTKKGEVFKNGQWKDWIPYLYNRGDQAIALTGGWKKFDNANQRVTFEKNFIDSRRVGSTNVEQIGYIGEVFVKNKIDLTKYRTLKADITTYGSDRNYAVIILGVLNKNSNADPPESSLKTYVKYLGYKAGPARDNGDYTISVDISAVTGSWYVYLEACVCDVKIHRIWMEV